MAAKWLRSGWTLGPIVAAMLLAVAGCVAYSQRDLLVAHWHVRVWLGGDDDANRVRWLREHRTDVLPILADALNNDDPAICMRAGSLIRAILDDLGEPTEPDAAQLSLVAMSTLRDEFPKLNAQARHEAAEAACILLRVHLRQWSPHVPTVLDSAGFVFASALQDADVHVKEAALRRLPEFWPFIAVDGSSGPLVREWLLSAYRTALEMLGSAEPSVRLAAAVACCMAPFSESDYRIAELLDDEDAAVRKGVLVALSECKRSRLQGEHKRLVVPFLSDADPTIAAAAVRLLKLADVPDDSIELLRWRNSPRSAERAKSAALFVEMSKRSNKSFSPSFLFDLSYDEAADVRLAFIDAAMDSNAVTAFHDRIRTMADKDPDAKVRARGKEAAAKLRIAVKQ
jgi:hypothetical protein